MSTVSTSDTVIVVSAGHLPGLRAQTYRNRLEMILCQIECADISGGGCYGDAAHRAALRLVSKRISETRNKIKKFNATR